MFKYLSPSLLDLLQVLTLSAARNLASPVTATKSKTTAISPTPMFCTRATLDTVSTAAARWPVWAGTGACGTNRFRPASVSLPRPLWFNVSTVVTYWQVSVIYLFFSEETVDSENCRERRHYNAITHTICVPVAPHAHNIQFSFTNDKMTKSSSFSCGTSRIHLNISWDFGRLIFCQKANLALAGAWQLLMRVESIIPDCWGDTVIFLLWIVICFIFFECILFYILLQSRHAIRHSRSLFTF